MNQNIDFFDLLCRRIMALGIRFRELKDMLIINNEISFFTFSTVIL
jgi:hypothetical protein